MNNGSKLWRSADARLKALEELEELVCTDRHARELQNTLLWPLATWPREVLLALYECDFDGVLGSPDAGMYKEFTVCFRGWVGRHGASNSCSTKLELWSPIEHTWLCGTEQSTPMLRRTLGEHPWLCSLRTKLRRVARCQRRCATVRRLISVQASSFSSGVCRANLPGPARSQRTRWPFRWLRGPCRSMRKRYDKLQTLFLSRLVQPHTMLIRHESLPGEPVWMGAQHLALGCASAARAREEI